MALPNIQQIVSIHAARIQTLENVAYSLILGRTLQGASGKTLEMVGEMLRQYRSTGGPDATDDSDYRALIFGKIAIDTSSSGPETVLALLKLLGADSVLLRPSYPAGIRLEIQGDDLLVDDAGLVTLLEQATAPISIHTTIAEPGGFGFSSDPNALGFGQGDMARSIS